MEVLSVGIWFVPVYPHPSWLKMAGVDKVGLSLPCFLLLLVSLNCLFNPLCFDKDVLSGVTHRQVHLLLSCC